MAVTKTIISCTPYINSSSKVDKWDITMKYENDNEGDSTYYTSIFNISVPQLDDDGNVTIFASKSSDGKVAKEMIDEIVAEPEIGKIYEGKVVKTTDFGAFVNFLGSRDGLVHISQLKEERVEKTTDVVKEGDQVKVKVIGVDDRGKVKLSI